LHQNLDLKLKIDKKYIADYPNWLRSEEVSSFIKETLDSPDARYADLVPKEDAITLYDKHMAGEDVSVELARYVTLEVWLQQIARRKIQTVDYYSLTLWDFYKKIIVLYTVTR
jgi:hypothetical protein